MHICVCAYIYCWQSFTMRQDFEGGIYWDECAETCCGIRGAVRFQGNTVYKMCIECYHIMGEITVDLISNIHQAGYFKAISWHHYVVKCLSYCSATT